MGGAIHIGTSGWHYRHWVGPFYPPGTPSGAYLDYYARHFTATEINGSFYRMPSERTLATWRDSVPGTFRFAVKASRFMSHAKKLAGPIELYAAFFGGIATLGPKLGPILIQLPPTWRVNGDRLRAFLRDAPRCYRYAVEFRNATWLIPAVYDVLAKHGAALCLYDIGGFQSPVETVTNFVYIRLHGPGAKYEGQYGTAALGAWAERIDRWTRSGYDVWCFFDNDQNGYAAADALRLQRLIATGAAEPRDEVRPGLSGHTTGRVRPTPSRSIR